MSHGLAYLSLSGCGGMHGDIWEGNLVSLLVGWRHKSLQAKEKWIEQEQESKKSLPFMAVAKKTARELHLLRKVASPD